MKHNIVPFAQRVDSNDTRSITLRWEEPRDIREIVVRTATASVQVEYWRKNWPQNRLTEAELQSGSIGRLGWKPRDDWFNGTWAPADVRCRRKGDALVVRFAPLARKEFPELGDFSVDFRQTLQLRITFPEPGALPDDVAVMTGTSLETREICVETECGKESRAAWDGTVEVYNGNLEGVVAPTAEDPRLRLRLTCAKAHALSFDHTIVTIRSSAATFSFRPDDLDSNPVLWSPDLAVMVSDAKRDIRYTPEIAANTRTGKTIHERILEQPEQSLAHALDGMPPKQPMHFIIGCEGRRQKFGVHANGDIFAREGYVLSVPGADTPRLRWRHHSMCLRMYLEDMIPNGRHIEAGSLPMVRSTYSLRDLDISHEVFATVLGGIDKSPLQGDDTVVAFAPLTFTNRGPEPLPVRRRMGIVFGRAFDAYFSAYPPIPESVFVEGDTVYTTLEGQKCFRMMVTPPEGVSLSAPDGDLLFEMDLPAGESREVVLKLPFVSPDSDNEIAALRDMTFAQEWRDVRRFWEQRLNAGAQLQTNEPDIDDFWRAHVSHVLINDDQEPGSNRLMGRVGSFNYGNYSNEAIMQIMDLDRRGYHDEARRHLDTYLRYQSTVGLPGNFSGKEGIFYGSGGYEQGEYNQHHGWVLWGMAEHYRMTGDGKWLLAIASQLIAGCEWVIRERRGTMQTDAQGRRVLEYGFLPAGSLEDVRDFQYWLSTNALTCRGLQAAADALADAGHPDGTRLVAEARAFHEDLRAGFEEMRVRTPLVRLRDGSFVPDYPSRLYWRGRDFGWIREVLEGSIILTTTIFEPTSPQSTWILKDFEDNRYLDAPYNYPLDDFEAQWFTCGGFSYQPNLLYFPPPYLFRDEIEHFLRAFFNGFAACWRREIRAMTEHPLPTLAGWAGDHFKSSDESMVTYWLRLMFIQEQGDDLYLGRGIPREWLAKGRKVSLKSAATAFGTMSLEMETSSDCRRIEARITPPSRKSPERVFVRFRHPDKAAIKAVRVDGKEWNDFSVEKEWVALPGLGKPTVVEAIYE